MSGIKKSSFQKRGTVNTNLIKGTKPSLHNSQLLVSSGLPSLDSLIGGGIPVGSILLINEDEYGTYAKQILKYFLAEGLVSQHAVYICSEHLNSETMGKELPRPVDADIEEDECQKDDRKMTIAWRYQNLKAEPLSNKYKYFGHYFDLSRPISDEVIKKSDITFWSKNEGLHGKSFQDTEYWYLLKLIRKKLEEGCFFGKQEKSERNILRIGLHRLNSSLWQYDSNYESSENFKYFFTFMYSLRSLIRNAYASCVITLPFNQYQDNFINKCIHLSDIAIQLHSFAGTKCEKMSPYKDYHGFFILQKLAAINSLVAYNPQVTNLVFKLTRKKLVIEEFYLPPELEETTEREQDDSNVLSCFSSKSSKLDF